MIPESVLPTVPVNNAPSRKAAEQSAAFSFTGTILPEATACFHIHTYTRLRGWRLMKEKKMIKRQNGSNPFAPMTETEMLAKLEKSREQGIFREADLVVSDMRLKYGLSNG